MRVKEVVLILGNNVKLTQQENHLLAMLSGSNPCYIRTRKQLVTFVETHMAHYGGPSPEERMIRTLLTDFLLKTKVGGQTNLPT